MAGVLLAKKKQTNEEKIKPWLRSLARLGNAHCSQITTLTMLPKFTNAQKNIFSQLDFYETSSSSTLSTFIDTSK